MTDKSTICRVINEHDNTLITLWTEWLDSGLKITIFSSESVPFIGQMKLTNIDMFAKNLSKTKGEYLKETRIVLSGKDASVKFMLKDLEFKWTKGAWKHGIIEMRETKLEKIFPEILKTFVEQHAELEKTVDEIKTENAELRVAQNRHRDKLEEIIEIKNKVEDDLYSRFIVVLNSKKEKIRELQLELGKREITTDFNKTDNKIFEAETEEDSEGSDDENIFSRSKTQGGRISSDQFLTRHPNNEREFGEEKLFKREMSDSEGKLKDPDYAIVSKTKRSLRNEKLTEFTVAKPSTSKSKNDIEKGKDNEENVEEKSLVINTEAKSMLNFDNEESDEDMFVDY